MQNTQQLNFCFEGDNRLSDNLLQGKFLHLVEFVTPLTASPREESLALTRKFAEGLSAEDDIFAVTVDDRLLGLASQDPGDYAAEILESSHKPVILTISGCGSDIMRVKSLLAEAKSRGIRNVFLTTGLLQADGTDTLPFLDSVAMLRQLNTPDNQEFHFGCAVNPYQYLLETQVLQYAKLKKKIQAGASFFVSQAGWDMKKAQELQWFLMKAGEAVSVFARICVFTAETVRQINAPWHGLQIPLAIASLLMQEATDDPDKFLERQFSRLALQIAGYRKLGYAGVQIMGIKDNAMLRQLLAAAREADAKYPDFASWLQAWNAEIERYEVTPSLTPHYLFQNLLLPGHQDYADSEPFANGLSPQPPLWKDKATSCLWSKLASPKAPAWLKNFAQKLSGRTPSDNLRLAECGYLSNDSCPKHLTTGQCGSSRFDGSCEDGSRPCFFLRVMRLLAAQKRLADLEKPPVASRADANSPSQP